MFPLADLVMSNLGPKYQFLYAIPLVVAFSLVYGATRHEMMVPILQHAARAAVWTTGFMLVIFGVLLFVSWMFL
jgi:hypothetical protein